MSILIISTSNSPEDYQADAAVLPNGKVLVSPDAVSGIAETLDRQIKMYKKMISDDTGNPASGDELLEGVASRWNNMVSTSKVFDDNEVDEAKKFVKASRMTNA